MSANILRNSVAGARNMAVEFDRFKTIQTGAQFATTYATETEFKLKVSFLQQMFDCSDLVPSSSEKIQERGGYSRAPSIHPRTEKGCAISYHLQHQQRTWIKRYFKESLRVGDLA